MLKQRILTAVVLVPALLLVILWLPPYAGVVVLALLMLMGAWEWSAFLRPNRAATRYLYVLATGALMGVAWYTTAAPASLAWLLSGALIWWAVAFVWLSWFPARVSGMGAAIAGLCVLVPAWVALGRLHLSQPAGNQWLVFLLVLVSIADVGAFFAGRQFGRVKLAPRVSPGKTWEGLMGGIVMAGVAAFAGLAWFDAPISAFLALCTGVVLLSVVGDLTESLFKRYAGLKDSGSIFPGHGGVLDRIDSVTAAAPLFLLGLGWLGVLA